MPHSRYRAAQCVGALLLLVVDVMSTPAARALDANWQVAARLSLGATGAVECPTTTTCWAVSGGALLFSDTGGTSWTDGSTRVPSSVERLDGIECPTADTCYLGGRQPDGRVAVVALTPSGDRVVALDDTNPLTSLTCPTASRCLASDRTHIFATTDAGVTWTHAAALPYGSAAAVGCAPGTRRCWAVGGVGGQVAVSRSLDGGLSWRPQGTPDVQGGLADVDCPTTTDCVAVGQGGGITGTIAVTHDGGATWTAPHLSAGTAPYPLYSVSCASVQVCTASGGPAAFGIGEPYAVRTGNGGAVWRRSGYGPQPYGNLTGARDLACPAPTRCVAVPGGVYTLLTTDGGTTWVATPIPAALTRINRMACPTATSCFALATDAVYRAVAMSSTDAGLTWSRTTLPDVRGYTAAGLECPTASACFALYVETTFDGVHVRTTATVLSTTDGGASWQTGDSVNARRLRTLSCASATTCLATGVEPTSTRPAMYATTNGGRTWSMRSLPAAMAKPSTVDCGSPASCVLIGGDGSGANSQVAVTTDLGATYTAGTLPPDAAFGPVACVQSTCHAIGGDTAGSASVIAVSTDGGLSWTSQAAPRANERLTSISCSSGQVCVIGASNGYPNHAAPQIVGTTDGGATWRMRTLPPSAVPVPDAVACLSPTAALAADTGPVGGPRILAGRP